MGYYWTDKYAFAPYFNESWDFYQSADPSGSGAWEGGTGKSKGYTIEYCINSGPIPAPPPVPDTSPWPNYWQWHWGGSPGTWCPWCGATLDKQKAGHLWVEHWGGTYWVDTYDDGTPMQVLQIWQPENSSGDPSAPPYLWYNLQTRQWVKYNDEFPTVMPYYAPDIGVAHHSTYITMGCCCNGSLTGNGYTQPTVAATASINGLTVNLYKLTDAQAATYVGKHIGDGPQGSTSGNAYFYNKPLLYKTNIQYPEGDVWQFQSDRKWHKVHPFYQKQSNGTWKAVQPYYYANTSSTWKKVEDVN